MGPVALEGDSLIFGLCFSTAHCGTALSTLRAAPVEIAARWYKIYALLGPPVHMTTADAVDASTVAVGSVDESTSVEAQPEPVPVAPAPWLYGGSEGEERPSASGQHFLVQEQIWNTVLADWVPFIPTAEKDYGDALFVVNRRRYNVQDAKVFTIVDLLDAKLIELVREICKDVENVFATRPSFDIKKVFPHIESIRERVRALNASKDEADTHDGAILRPFLQVVEEEIGESRGTLERLLAKGKITFKLLWAIFRPGVCVRATHEPSGESLGVVLDAVEEITYTSKPMFQLRGTTLAWTGKQYEHVPWVHNIEAFEGPRDLGHLPVTVIEDSRRAILTERGRKYTQYVGVHHVHVSGGIFVPEQGTFINTPANGRAMIDVLTSDPQYTGNLALGLSSSPSMAVDFVWSLAALSAGPAPCTVAASVHVSMDRVPEESLWLLSPVMRGYSFAAKVWGDFCVKDIEPVVYDEKAWDHLVLDAETKTLIRSLVHVQARRDARVFGDWIKGKGGGLVFLLHGVAGVGKTLTAEAVAELLHRPLYVVGSGELGDHSSKVEPALRKCLDLATKWNAILLVDEADVFLEKRGNADLVRNALVATFLRLLEYHAGVLFLTTNRVKSFDQAFLSRVSVAIKYEELDIVQRSTIWWQFLNQVITASDEAQDTHSPIHSDGKPSLLHDENIKALAMKPFNGRVIKNVVQTAQALALSADEPLTMSHLRAVIKVTEKFMRDTEDVRNDDDNSDSFDPENEVISLT